MENIKNSNIRWFGDKVNNVLGSDGTNRINVLRDKNIHQVLHFKYEDFLNLDNFYSKMMWGIKLDKEYSIIVRVNYTNPNADNAKEYKMLGKSKKIDVSTYDSLYNWFVDYYKAVVEELEMSTDIYQYSLYDILEFQFIVYVYSDEIIKKLIKFRKDSLAGHKDLINISRTIEGFNKLLPLTYDKEKFGNLLNKKVFNNSINSITLEDGKEIDILELINNKLPFNKRLANIDGSIDFYQNNIKGRNILISVESTEDMNIIDIYSVEGMHIYRMVDKRINYNSFTRTIGNVKSYIDNTGIYDRDIIIKFSRVYPLPYKARHSLLLHPEWKLGSLDIETYTINNDVSKAYAIGFYAKGKVETFYIDQNLNSDVLIKRCLDKMLSEEYNGYTFYVHNLAKYDNYYIIPVLLQCVSLYPEIYNYKFVFRDDHVIGIKISKKVKIYKKDDKSKKSKKDNKDNKFYFKTYSVRIVDSYTLLSTSLDKLCVTFNTEIKKSIFPYKFIHQNNLFYIGKKPDIQFFKFKVENKCTGVLREEVININEYNLIKNENWSVKEETLTYLQNDLISLYQVIEKFNKHLYNNYSIHIVESLTISSLTMNVFLRNYYKNNIPLIKQKSVYNDLKKSYYGGITEVYRPYGKNLYLYDVNSLYPFVALNSMPGLNCIYKDNINKDFSELKNNIFGYFYCRINAPMGYLGLLPYRTKSGLISPIGMFEGFYFSEELKFAYENGYKITVLSGYQFDKTENVFNDYVKHLYEIKSTTKDDVIRAITKSLLNNLLGRWGLNINKYITRFVSHNEFEWIKETREIRSFRYVEDKVLVTYDKEVSQDVCDLHKLDYRKVLLDNIENESDLLTEHDKFNDVSVAISSAVTSYARIFMNRIKLDILEKGGRLYYTDTDSIVTDIKLDNKLVGNDIGQFKLVHEINEAYFISNKSYALKTTNNKTIIKCKGFASDSLSFEDFEKVYNGNVIERTRRESRKDYNKGVIIYDNEIKFSPFSYTKRVKILNKDKLWIDTLPINIQNNTYHTLYPNINNKSNNINIKSNKIKRLFIIFSIITLYTLCVISSVVYLFLLPQSENITDNLINILNITDFSDIVDTTDIIDYIDYIRFIDLDTENKSIVNSMLKNWFNKFIELFSNNKHIFSNNKINYYYIKNIENPYDFYTINKEIYISDSISNTKVDITKPLLRHNLDSLAKDVSDLQDQVSLLKVQLQKERIENIDVRKYYEQTIDYILHDLELMQNKISSSPRL